MHRTWMHVQALVYFVGKLVIANDNKKLQSEIIFLMYCSRLKVDIANILQF